MSYRQPFTPPVISKVRLPAGSYEYARMLEESIRHAFLTLPDRLRVRGVFIGTLVGWSDLASDSFYYEVAGKMARLWIPLLTGTNNSTTISLSGIPSAAWPTTAQNFVLRISDNGTAAFGRCVINTDGTVDFFRAADASTWTGSGTAIIYSTTLQWDLAGQ